MNRMVAERIHLRMWHLIIWLNAHNISIIKWLGFKGVELNGTMLVGSTAWLHAAPQSGQCVRSWCEDAFLMIGWAHNRNPNSVELIKLTIGKFTFYLPTFVLSGHFAALLFNVSCLFFPPRSIVSAIVGTVFVVCLCGTHTHTHTYRTINWISCHLNCPLSLPMTRFNLPIKAKSAHMQIVGTKLKMPSWHNWQTEK